MHVKLICEQKGPQQKGRNPDLGYERYELKFVNRVEQFDMCVVSYVVLASVDLVREECEQSRK